MTVSTADQVIASVIGEGWIWKRTIDPIRPTRDEIAKLAYHMWETNGRQDGRDVEDWLRAEQQLVRHYA